MDKNFLEKLFNEKFLKQQSLIDVKKTLATSLWCAETYEKDYAVLTSKKENLEYQIDFLESLLFSYLESCKK